MSNYDSLAVRILLNTKPGKARDKALANLAKKAREDLEGPPCPYCGAAGPHEDNNGRKGIDLTYLCGTCFEQFDH